MKALTHRSLIHKQAHQDVTSNMADRWQWFLALKPVTPDQHSFLLLDVYFANDAVLKNALVQAHYTTGFRDALITYILLCLTFCQIVMMLLKPNS